MATDDTTAAAALSMKLLVDTTTTGAQRVLFAGASSDLVDFLFSLLALPVGTAVCLLGEDAMVGCVGNLYSSVVDLDGTYVQPGSDKDALLRPVVLSPAVISASSSSLLGLPPAPATFLREDKPKAPLFRCGNKQCCNNNNPSRSSTPFGGGFGSSNSSTPFGGGFRSSNSSTPFGGGFGSAAPSFQFGTSTSTPHQINGHGDYESCRNYATDTSGTACPSCGRQMTTAMELVSSPGQAAAAAATASSWAGGAKGFVQGIVTYTVMDDLKVTPTSSISAITSLLSTFGVRDVSALQEKTVQLGYDEGLAILKASLQSKTVLTDVFLAKKSTPSSRSA